MHYINTLVLTLFFLFGGTGINIVHNCHHCHHHTAEQTAQCHCHHGDHDCCWFKHLTTDTFVLSQHEDVPAQSEHDLLFPVSSATESALDAMFTHCLHFCPRGDHCHLCGLAIPIHLGHAILQAVCRWIL